MTGEGIESGDFINLITKKFKAECFFVSIGRMYFDHVAAHPESAPLEGDIVPLVKHIHQF